MSVTEAHIYDWGFGIRYKLVEKNIYQMMISSGERHSVNHPRSYATEANDELEEKRRKIMRTCFAPTIPYNALRI